MNPYERGYKARMNGEPNEPQGDLTISENMSWKRGWETADNSDDAPEIEDE